MCSLTFTSIFKKFFIVLFIFTLQLFYISNSYFFFLWIFLQTNTSNSFQEHKARKNVKLEMWVIYIVYIVYFIHN